MKRIMIMAAMLIVATTTLYAENETRNLVIVNGKATIEVEPNQFTLRITLDEGDTKGRRPLAEQQRELIAALTSVGVDCSKQLKTYDMNSDWLRRRTSLSTMQFSLTLPSTEMLFKTYEALMPLGVSNVELQNVTHTDLKSYESKVRRKAIQNAKAKAVELATAIGQNIGICCSINDYGSTTESPIRKNNIMSVRASIDEANRVPSLEPTSFNNIKISYGVSAQFILTDK